MREARLTDTRGVISWKSGSWLLSHLFFHRLYRSTLLNCSSCFSWISRVRVLFSSVFIRIFSGFVLKISAVYLERQSGTDCLLISHSTYLWLWSLLLWSRFDFLRFFFLSILCYFDRLSYRLSVWVDKHLYLFWFLYIYVINFGFDVIF